MERIFGSFLLGVLQIGLSSADYTCTNWDYSGGYQFCDHGCCDSWPYETCCPDSRVETWLGWAIAGGVIGGILLISLVVCVVCTFMKQKGKSGRVIQPNQGQTQPPVYAPTVTYVSYPQNQVGFPHLPAYTTNPSAPPPAYQSVYDQNPPPLPVTQNQVQPPLQTGSQNQGLPPLQTGSHNQVLPPLQTGSQNQVLPPLQTGSQNQVLPPLQTGSQNQAYQHWGH